MSKVLEVIRVRSEEVEAYLTAGWRVAEGAHAGGGLDGAYCVRMYRYA